jgi:hypothetical protein
MGADYAFWAMRDAACAGDHPDMPDQNRCPTCGRVPEEASSLYCSTHRGELLAECEHYVAAWARVQVANCRSAKTATAA